MTQRFCRNKKFPVRPAEVFFCEFQFLFTKRRTMDLSCVLLVWAAAPYMGAHHYQRWFVLFFFSVCYRLFYAFEVISFNTLHVPVIGLEPFKYVFRKGNVC
jgi:hypothetical protein